MTAIAGLWDLADGNPDPILNRMLAAQAIYGRHSATRLDGPVALGRRLWPLTPEDAFDRGPATGAAGSPVLVADARIDNRAEIGNDLGLPPDRLATMSDAALILALIEARGEAGIERLVGAFALACWDAPQERLLLARDAVGERPLHFHRGAGFVAVASMPKGLHAHPAVGYAANIAASADFLALVPETGGESFFEGIERVLPGHVVTIDRHATVVRRWWHPDTTPLRLAGADAYAGAMRAELDRAVACRLRRAGGRVGAHLSAGLDSSIVAATAARQLDPARLTAFTAVPAHATVAPPGTIADEGPIAAAMAAFHPNIDHVRVAPPALSPVAMMDRQFQLFERPVLNPSNAVWSEAINDAAQAHGVGVLLTGQMGNFTISHDGWQLLPALFGTFRWLRLARVVHRIARRGVRMRHVAATTLGPFVPPGIWSWLTRLAGRELSLASYSALRADAFGALRVEDRASARGLDLSYRPWRDSVAMRLWGMERVDLGVYNKGTLAGWGLDLRDPTADRRLIEFALRVPEEQFILGGVPRDLARRAFADRLPPDVTREVRRGFQGADWPVHLATARGDIAAELDSFERCAGAAALVDIARLRRALDAWPQDGWEREDVTLLYRHAMMRAVAAGHFLRKVARTN